MNASITLSDKQKEAIHAAAQAGICSEYIKEIDQTIGELRDSIRASETLIARLDKQKADIQEIVLKDSYTVNVNA